MDREAWLKSLKPGDMVVAHCEYAKPTLQRVVFVDSEKIFYGPSEYPDWVWIGNGAALIGTKFWRAVERPQ